MNMTNMTEIKAIFNDVPFFDGAKGFSVVYLDGLFHLYFPYCHLHKAQVIHYYSNDGYSWQGGTIVLEQFGRVDSVTAYVQNGKIFLYVAVKNFIGNVDVKLAISRDGEDFEFCPQTVIKNTQLRDIKIFYSGGKKWIIGSEKKGELPVFYSTDSFTWYKGNLKEVADDNQIIEYLGSPSPFVAGNKTYLAYTMFGGHIARAEINLEKGELKVGKMVMEGYGDTIRSLMLGEGTPLVFIGLSTSLIPLEVYGLEDDLGVRFYRECLKGAKIRVDNGKEENARMPKLLVREEGILHQFEMPIEKGVSLDFGGTIIEIDENLSVVVDGYIENYGIVDRSMQEGDVLDISVIDFGNLIIVEVLDKVYAVHTDMSDRIGVKVGEKDYEYTSYKL